MPHVHVEIPAIDGEPGNVTQLQIAAADVPTLTDEEGLKMNRYPVPWREDGAEWIVFQVGGAGVAAHVEIPQAGDTVSNVLQIQVATAALTGLVDEANLSIQPGLGAGLVLLHEPTV